MNRGFASVVIQNSLSFICHSGLDKPAPYLIRGNPVFSVWIPAEVYPVLVLKEQGGQWFNRYISQEAV
jgi:hypothetical protein